MTRATAVLVAQALLPPLFSAIRPRVRRSPDRPSSSIAATHLVTQAFLSLRGELGFPCDE